MSIHYDMCQKRKISISAIFGVATLFIFWALMDFGFFIALIAGIVVGVLVYIALNFYSNKNSNQMHIDATSGAVQEKAIPSAQKADIEDSAAPTDAVLNTQSEDFFETEVAVEQAFIEDEASGEIEAQAEPTAFGGGEKPVMLKAAREGGADDLKMIKGVGPKLEVMLNEMGVYHFDQVASWSANEIAWMDQNIARFKGRASRDSWVPQAQALAAGEQTEFSKKVAKGGVYKE